MVVAPSNIAENLARLRDSIAEAAARMGRRPEEITLVGVSKTQPAEALAAAVRAGVQHIGENRVQEAEAKFGRLHEVLEDVALPTRHMIGHLQTNKVATATELFDRIDSVDSLKLVQALGRRAGGHEVRVLLEVYVGTDPDRTGLRPDGIEDAVGKMLEVANVRIEGVMTIAPLGEPSRPAFARVRELKVRLAQAFPRVHFGVLSMGMSEDYQIAIEEGSTEVRIGTALFGPRQPK